MNKWINSLCVLFFFFLLGAGQVTADTEPVEDLLVTNAWVRAMPPGSMMTAAYANFTNGGYSDVLITGFSSPQYRSVSLHQTTVDESGVSKMVEVTQLQLTAGEVMVLAPGGKHLMLMGAVNGNPDNVDIFITYGDKNIIKVGFPVEKR